VKNTLRRRHLKKFDTIVVGGGTAGSVAAKTLASAGLNVCLVDRKEKESIGKKVCGDAIGKHHFDNLGLSYPEGEELERDVVGIKVYSPDLETVFRLVGEGLPGFMVNRYVFGQRLLKDALDVGVELLDSVHVSRPIIEDGHVVGVSAKNTVTNSKIELRSEVTVDASGVTGVLRRKLPTEMGIDREVSREDQGICYREIRELREEMGEPDFCEIYLDPEVTPGGYVWIFPEGGTRVNVGLGVAGVGNYPSPKRQLYKHVLSRPMFGSSKVVQGGGGIVPIRRPLDSLVGNGIVVIGDASCQANPIHGGGIGPSMTGGRIAGEVVAEALETGGPSLERLWPINVLYMRNYGAKQAGLEIFRLFLQGLTKEDLDYGMQYRLIKEDDVIVAGQDGDVYLNVTEATRRVFRGLGRFSFLRKLYNMARMSKRAKALYRVYPDAPEGISDWKAKVQELFEEARKAF